MAGLSGGWTPVDRRYLVLTVVRFVPTGLAVPVVVLLVLDRGLSLADAGLAMASQSLVVVLLELPTGGLADALGRRAVLQVASLLNVASVALFLAASSLATFAAAMALQGAYRALESGPLDAWYVDASLAADPRADIEMGLARGATATGAAISAGALLAAGLTALPQPFVHPLALPLVVGLLVQVANLVALTVLLDGEPSARGWPAARAGARAAPAVVRATLGLLRTSPALAALVAVELLWGAGLTGVELFTAPRLADLIGDPERGAVVVGVATSVAWSAAAAGSALTGRLGALVGGSGPPRLGGLLRIAQGASVLLVALVAGPVALVGGYLGFYLVHGTSNAVHYGMVHRLTAGEQRATMLSANSLAARLGGIGAGVGLGALASAAGIPAALTVSAVVLAAAAPLYRVAGRARPVGAAA